MNKPFLTCLAALSLAGCLQTTQQIAGNLPDAGGPQVTCTPKTCADLAAACGSPDDGCGKPLSCGTCGSGFVCSSARTCVATQISTCSPDGFCLEAGQLTAETLRGVYAVDENRVWAVGDNGTVLRKSSTGWKRIALPVGVDPATHLLDVHGFGTDDVWVVGENGTALHYSDSVTGGWTNFSVAGGSPTLRAIFGTSESDVYIAGDSLYHFDGGLLSGVPGPLNTQLYGGAVLPDGRLVVIGADADKSMGLFSREANGTTWTPRDTFPTKYRISLCGNGNVALFGSYSSEGGHVQTLETTGWTQVDEAYGGGGQYGLDDGVCLYDNGIWSIGGRELREAATPANSLYLEQNSFRAVDATSTGVIWAVGTSGLVYRVQASERRLEKMHGPKTEGRTVLTASSSTNVWLLSSDGVSERFDGSSWTQVPSPNPMLKAGELVPAYVTGVAVEPNRVSLAANRRFNLDPVLYTHDGTEWKLEPVPFPNETQPIAVGHDGSKLVAIHRNYLKWEFKTVVQSADGSWSTLSTQTPSLMSLYTLDSLVGVQVDNNASSLYQWSSGGWVVLSPTLPIVNGVWVNGSLGYAATYEGLYSRTHVGWERDSRLPTSYFTAVQGTSANDIWAAGYGLINDTDYDNQLYHFDGTSWNSIKLGVNIPVRNMYVTATDIWLLLRGGTLLHKAR